MTWDRRFLFCTTDPMEKIKFNPLNLLIRFLLELTALFGYWGWKTSNGGISYLSMILGSIGGVLVRAHLLFQKIQADLKRLQFLFLAGCA